MRANTLVWLCLMEDDLFAGHRNGQHTNLFKQMVECKICKKTIQLKNLKSHVELIHEKQKNFSCELCGKMFGKRCLVKEHMESHKVCLAVFRNLVNLFFVEFIILSL